MATSGNKLVFIVKTHYISQFHVAIWLDLTLSSCCDRCVILLNNEDDVLDRLVRWLPEAMRADIIPFKAADFAKISLPVVPRTPPWRNSWRNGDYGAYYVRSLMPSLQPEDWIVQIDNDLVTSHPWSAILPRLPLDSIDFFSRRLSKVGDKWGHYKAAKAFYGEKPVAMSLFGLQGYRVGVVDFLYEKRLTMAYILEKRLQEQGLDLFNLTEEQARSHWPLCEAHVGTEILNSRYRNLDLETFFQTSFEFYSLHLADVDFKALAGKPDDAVFFYHPIKDPVYQSFYKGMVPLQEYAESCTLKAAREAFVRWESPETLFLHPNIKNVAPVSTMALDMPRQTGGQSAATVFGTVKLVQNAQAPVNVSCALRRGDAAAEQALQIEIPPGGTQPFCFSLPPDVRQLVFSSESASEQTAGCCQLRISNLFVFPE